MTSNVESDISKVIDISYTVQLDVHACDSSNGPRSRVLCIIIAHDHPAGGRSDP